MINNLRKITSGLMVVLLLIVSWSSASHSQDQSGKRRLPADQTSTSKATSASHDSAALQDSAELTGTMNVEEKLVRDVYARLMRYQSAAIDELAARSGKTGEPTDYLTFELRNIRSGPATELSERNLAEILTERSGAIISLMPVHLSEKNGPAHAYYEAQWTTLAGVDGRTSSQKAAESFAKADGYTSYQVTANLNGKQRTYRAMVLYRSNDSKPEPQQPRSNEEGRVEILDNVTVDMNMVYREESPLVRAPWNKYVKTGLYRAIAKAIKEKEQAGQPLRSADDPIGYMPIEPIDPGDGGGGGGGGGGGQDPPPSCLNIMIKKTDDSSLPSPFRIGITANNHNRTQHLKAVVFPFAEAANVTISVSSGLTLSNVSTPSPNGIIMFDVVGKTESQAKGDQTITADHSSGYFVTQSVTVVVPSKVGTPHDTVGGGMAIANRVLDSTTSPAVVGLQPGQVALVTTYLRFVDVLVWDRFNETIGTIYQGAEVFEGVTINQFLTAASTYSDPVGYVELAGVVQAGSPAAQAWPSQPLIPLGNRGSTVQNIAVQVDGFSLNPAIVSRTVTANPPNNVTITWP